MFPLFWLVLAGFTGGILAGLLGIGGGIIYVLVLPYALRDAGFSPEYMPSFTIANSLFGVLSASLAANYLNIRNHDFYPKESMWVGIPGAIFSVLILKTIVIQTWYSITYFYTILILFLAYMFISLFLKKEGRKNKHEHVHRNATLSMAGIIGGSLAAATGLGGGAAVVPILNTRLHMNIKKARSVSHAMIWMTALVLTVFNLLEKTALQNLTYQVGLIYFPVVIPMTIGVLAGSPIGSKLGRKWSSRTIRILFGVFILIVIFEKLYQII